MLSGAEPDSSLIHPASALPTTMWLPEQPCLKHMSMVKPKPEISPCWAPPNVRIWQWFKSRERFPVFLDWYDGTVKTGLDVYAAGFPLVEPEYNLTKGIVSKVDAGGQTYWASLDYIYGHDAKINGGNSGGPLVTEDGKVVGINYMSRASVDQQFAIPGELAVPIVDQLQEEKNVASVGLAGQAVVFGPNGEYPGIWVESTTTGGIADKAGILPGDIIHEVETILIATDGSMKDYCDILSGHKEDDPLKVMVYRPTTDEILEGTLNGDKLVSTGVAGLSGTIK